MKHLIAIILLSMGIIYLGYLVLPEKHKPPTFTEVQHGQDWNSHTYLLYRDTIIHAEHCRCNPRSMSVVVTNVFYRTNVINDYR